MALKAPDWFDNHGGPARSRPPPPLPPDPNDPNAMNRSGLSKAPPPLPGRTGAASTAPGQRPLPALPGLPAVPAALGQASGQAAAQLALPPPPGAPPSLAALPSPPPPPGGPREGLQTGGGAGGGIIALALQDATQDAAAKGQVALRTAVKAKPAVQDEKPFEIWGLQHRAYSMEELRVAFDMLDLDRHDCIGPQDLRRVLDLVGEGDVTEPELREMMRLVDSDARGKVDFDEFADQFTDPPAVFRNYDMHKREGVMVKAEIPRGSHTASSSSRGDLAFVADMRGDAVKLIMGKRKLTPEFIKTVYQRFVELDVDERGFISFQDFCFILRRAESEDMQRAFNIFDHAHIGELDLREFIVGISMYTSSSTEEKLKFAFMMFDEEQCEEVEHADVEHLFLAVAPHLVEEVRHAHEQRMYQLLNLHPSMGVRLDEFLDYCLEYADELVPVSPSPSTASRTRSSGTNTRTASSYSSSPKSGSPAGSGRAQM